MTVCLFCYSTLVLICVFHLVPWCKRVFKCVCVISWCLEFSLVVRGVDVICAIADVVSFVPVLCVRC